MDRYIIDCSVAVKWFVPEELSETARGLLLQLDAGTTTLIAPDSFLAEFGHSLRTQVRRGIMTANAASAALSDMTMLPLSLIGTLPLAVHAFDLALAHMATFYDALYIALAIREDLKVLTADDGMANAFAPLDRIVRLADLAAS